MILLPRREPFGSEVIRQLKLRGIPVAGADRIVLTEQIAVMDLIALGRFVLQRGGRSQSGGAAALAALRPERGGTVRALPQAATARCGSAWRRADETPSFAAAHAFLSRDAGARRLRAALRVLCPCPDRARASGASCSRGWARKPSDAIDEFLSLALAYEQGHTPSLEGFLRLDRARRHRDQARHGARPRRSAGDDGAWRQGSGSRHRHPARHHRPCPIRPAARAIFCITDDGVLYPAAAATKRRDAVMQAKAKAEDARCCDEHRRLLYVALTRARDRLYVCGFENKKGVKPDSWYALAERAARATGPRGRRAATTTVLVIGDTGEEASAHCRRASAAPAVAARLGRARQRRAERASPRLIRPSDAAGVRGTRRHRRRAATRSASAAGCWCMRCWRGCRRSRRTAAPRDRAALSSRPRGDAKDAEALATKRCRVLNDPAVRRRLRARQPRRSRASSPTCRNSATARASTAASTGWR